MRTVNSPESMLNRQSPAAIAHAAMPLNPLFPSLTADQADGAAHPHSSLYQVLLSEMIVKACKPGHVSHRSAAAMAHLGSLHRFDSQSAVLAAGRTPAHSLWLLVEGRVSLGKGDRAGRWWQSKELGPGEWIDVSSAWTGNSHPETALALTPVLVHEFPVEEVDAHCLGDSALARALLASVASQACRSTLQKQALLTKDANARIAAWLLESCKAPLDAREAELSLSQQKRDIASQLGLTPETLSRGLRRLQEMGLLSMRGYKFKFPDLEGLRLQADLQVDH